MEKKELLVLQDVQKGYSNLPVLKGINLSFKEGEFISIVGKSGCGKSTLLRMLAGLESVSGGNILMNGKKLESLNTNARIMFQDGRLLPWKNIIQNIGLGLTGDWKDRAMEALRSVGLEDRASNFPSSLSGGQKQRIALGRALVHEPQLLLLDEPLGALDALTRMEMQKLIESIWANKHFTTVLVTHDVEEAVMLSDRVIVLRDGKVSMNQTVNLPRPRQRSNPAFNSYVEEILDQIMSEEKSLKKVAYKVV
ncbi:ATP-binding cassette domain-containing protein [Bacillus sp. USDA818B3_A]|uniref:ATP-binding cassette domain-containing protein n=1 Tax=Bacillus sp. USDA818B3_A TaxID=2698834 RepID=UPI001368CF4A|nr:ATP-binding cassette domain-containing protein [Bacillus sp. USDA818B3_A]